VEGSRAALRVDELVRDVESFARAGFPKDVVLSSHVPSDVWSVAGDPTQLHQVLLNLYVNARDSMPDGGRIDVVVSNCDVNASEAAEMRRMTAGRYVVMEVKDEGMGMGRDVMERIFEPFFTTKEAGKGTGLGLSTVLGIVRSHAGYVQVESEQGKGTKFRVYIPALVEGESEGASGSVVVNGRSLDEGKVLLVDDDEVLLDVTRQMLEVAGYRVVIARDGAEALRIYQQQSESIRAVVTDLLMPSMDGWTLIHALRQVDAGIPIIAISGVGVHEARARQAGADNFLAKPLPITRLLEALRNMAGLPTPQ
jgi:two-component system cell cycle sensor histidine kinase/response regulator CckA